VSVLSDIRLTVISPPFKCVPKLEKETSKIQAKSNNKAENFFIRGIKQFSISES
jgi:hypothetical protein